MPKLGFVVNRFSAMTIQQESCVVFISRASHCVLLSRCNSFRCFSLEEDSGWFPEGGARGKGPAERVAGGLVSGEVTMQNGCSSHL